MEFPAALVRRIDAAEAESWRREELATDLEGVVIEEFDGALAFVTPGYPNTLFNRTVGLGGEHSSLIPDIVRFYERHGVPPRLDLTPARSSAPLVEALTAAGLEPGGFPFFSRRVMAGPVALAGSGIDANGIVVARLEPTEAGGFHQLVTSTWPIPVGEVERRRRRLDGLIPREDVQILAARDGEEVLGAAMLFLVDAVGYLGLAVTREECRGRGVHTALVQSRINTAREHGCDLLTSLVAAESGSQRNLERAGLSIVGDRQTWLPPDWTSHRFYADSA